MELTAIGIEPWLTGRMIENDVMAIMTVIGVIAVRSVQVMAFIADTI